MVDVFTIIPEEIFGVPTLPLAGLIFGIVLAINEAVRTKYRDVALKIKAKGEVITFDNKYIVTAIIGVVVVVSTVVSVKETGILRPISNDFASLFACCMAGFTEGWAVIKTLNKRVDLFIKKKAVEVGAPEEVAEKVADAVEFVEVGAPAKSEETPAEKPQTVEGAITFEEL